MRLNDLNFRRNRGLGVIFFEETSNYINADYTYSAEEQANDWLNANREFVNRGTLKIVSTHPIVREDSICLMFLYSVEGYPRIVPLEDVLKVKDIFEVEKLRKKGW